MAKLINKKQKNSALVKKFGRIGSTNNYFLQKTFLFLFSAFSSKRRFCRPINKSGLCAAKCGNVTRSAGTRLTPWRRRPPPPRRKTATTRTRWERSHFKLINNSWRFFYLRSHLDLEIFCNILSSFRLVFVSLGNKENILMVR